MAPRSVACAYITRLDARRHEPLFRRTFPPQQLLAAHPPRPQDANKRVVFGLTCPPDAVHAGEIHASRWPSADPPPTSARQNLWSQVVHPLQARSYPQGARSERVPFGMSDCLRFHPGPNGWPDCRRPSSIPGRGHSRRRVRS